MEAQLQPVRDKKSWEAYHAIRRRVLYEMRGRDDYDEKHPDEHRRGNFPLLFSIRGIPVGTARLDIGTRKTAIGYVRLVAIVPEYQRQGIGKQMMLKLEAFAVLQGIQRLEVSAAPDALLFYEKLGWHFVDPARQPLLLAKAIA